MISEFYLELRYEATICGLMEAAENQAKAWKNADRSKSQDEGCWMWLHRKSTANHHDCWMDNAWGIRSMKKALLLNSSHNDLGLIRALRKLGFYIIATGIWENLPGQKFVDEYIQADYSDKEWILSIAKEKNVDAICPCCNDFGVYTAAYVAEKLGLGVYDSYQTTCILHNKDKFKAFAREHDLLSPISESFSDVETAIEAAKQMAFPLIIKPTDASAGNGVTKVESEAFLADAVKCAFEGSRIKKIVIEPYIEGSQHGFCTFLINQKVRAYCTNDEYSVVNPYRVEIDTYPASVDQEINAILIQQIEKIAKILDLKDGIFHLQYILKDGKPWIIEVMRRILGNMYSVPANLLTGIDWDYWEVRARCGLGCLHFPQMVQQEGYYAYKTVLARENGKIKEINIPHQYDKYIFHQFLLHKEGDRIGKYQKEPIGFLFMMFSSEEEMLNVLVENYRNDLVVIEHESGERL